MFSVLFRFLLFVICTRCVRKSYSSIRTPCDDDGLFLHFHSFYLTDSCVCFHSNKGLPHLFYFHSFALRRISFLYQKRTSEMVSLPSWLASILENKALLRRFPSSCPI